MKGKAAGLVTVLLAGSMVISSSAYAGRIQHRQIRQQRRIQQGIVFGELTRGEAFRLERQQYRIQRAKHRACSDGTLTPKERLRIEHMQDRSSQAIYRLKHNDRSR